MGVWRFRALVFGLFYATLFAASPGSAVLGFFFLLLFGFALAPIDHFAPNWLMMIGVLAVGAFFAYRTARGLYRARVASSAGNHDAARADAFKAMLYAGVPSMIVLSMNALVGNWPA